MEIDLKLAGIDANNKMIFAETDSIKLKNELDRSTMLAKIDAVTLENKQLIEDIKKARTENDCGLRTKKR